MEKLPLETVLITCTDRLVDAMYQLREELHDLTILHDVMQKQLVHLTAVMEGH